MAKRNIPVSIFMAANQIPLLALAQSDASDQKADDQLFSVFRDLIDIEEDNDIEKYNKTIEVVAFTDPNDLLSYKIEELTDASVTNVIISNTMSFFEFFELLTPMPFTTWSFGLPFMKAHEHYLENDSVWKLILCGRLEDCSALQ